MEQHQSYQTDHCRADHRRRPRTGRSSGNIRGDLRGSLCQRSAAVAPVLIFFLVIGSLCRAKTGKSGTLKTVIVLYLIGTFAAAVVAVIVSFIIPMSITLTEAATENTPPEGITQVLHDLLMQIVDNPVSALYNANFIGVLAWAILIGVALRMASDHTKSVSTIFPMLLQR